MEILNWFLWQGTITHISVGHLHKNWTDFLHSSSSQRLDSSRPGEQGRSLGPDPLERRRLRRRGSGDSALVTNSQSEFLKKRTRSIAVTVTVTHCQHHSKGWKLNSARKHLDSVTVYPRHLTLFQDLAIFPAQYYSWMDRMLLLWITVSASSLSSSSSGSRGGGGQAARRRSLSLSSDSGTSRSSSSLASRDKSRQTSSWSPSRQRRKERAGSFSVWLQCSKLLNLFWYDRINTNLLL